MKQHAPATLRNRDGILDVLRRVVPAEAFVLEIASGTGEHAIFFCEGLDARSGEQRVRWQPTDVSDEALESVSAHLREHPTSNVEPPVYLDTTQNPWPVQSADLIFCANMVHIAPFEAVVGLFEGAARVLPSGGALLTYGPYRIEGVHTAPSNVAFDEWLQQRDTNWGVRDLDDLIALGKRVGLALEERVAMPANNFTLIWLRCETPGTRRKTTSTSV